MAAAKKLPKMVGWYDPTLFIRAGWQTLISTVFAQYADQRLIQGGRVIVYDYTHQKMSEIDLSASKKSEENGSADRKEIWIDYVADVGDGWNSTYTVAYLLTQPSLDVKKPGRTSEIKTLPEGNLLIFGGDEVYPSGSRVEYQRRLVEPYRSAFGNRREPYPDVFALPGNHDWYDSLVSFSRLFGSKEPFAGPMQNGAGSSIGCQTPQRRSYFALKLPHGWWLLGTDVQLGGDLDGPQLDFFKAVVDAMTDGDRVILCTAEPHWLYPKRAEKRESEEMKTALEVLEQEVLRKKVVVFLAGDVHHYSRYEATDGTQQITAGGGGAFLHPTHGPWPVVIKERDVHDAVGNATPGRVFNYQSSYPKPSTSWLLGCRNLFFPILNPWFGLLTGILYVIFCLMIFPAMKRWSEMELGDREAQSIVRPGTGDLLEARGGGGTPVPLGQTPRERKEIAPVQRIPLANAREPDALRKEETEGPGEFQQRGRTDRRENFIERLERHQAVPPARSAPVGTAADPRTKQMSFDQAPKGSADVTSPQPSPGSPRSVQPEGNAIPYGFNETLWGVFTNELLQIPEPFEFLSFILFFGMVVFGFIFFTDIPNKKLRYLFGFLHAFAHYLAAFLLVWLCTWLGVWVGRRVLGVAIIDELSLLYIVILVFLSGWVVGSLIMGCYLWIALNLFKRHWNEAFSSLRIADWKNFIRLHIAPDGTLTIYPIGVPKVPRRWKPSSNPEGSLLLPVTPLRPELIENEISIKGVRVQNWFGDLVSYPQVVEEPRTVDEITAILQNPQRYPSPVRAVGSCHSTTRCGAADGGTLVKMTHFNRILNIGPDSVTAEAGALYIDVANELRKHNLQFHVNVELGNLSIGSAACGGTKDASMPGELGQVCSYASRIKLVTPAGERIEFGEDQPDLLQAARSSYGLFGVVYEVTFRVRPLERMSVRHVIYSLDEFTTLLPDLIARNESMMLYLFPFQDRIVVEFRKYQGQGRPSRKYIWKLRNWVWSEKGPWLAGNATRLIPVKSIRYFLLDRFNLLIQRLLVWVIKGASTVPTDQLIRYPAEGGASKYTFSLWAFPEGSYPDVLRGYFTFCKEYYQKTGYRCDLPNVGYRIARDTNSLFSYSSHGTVMTVDPVSTGNPGWDDFLVAYNEFSSKKGGIPLFNQTRAITRAQAEQAFGEHLEIFSRFRQRFDPTNRLLNEYFREFFDHSTANGQSPHPGFSLPPRQKAE